jgi:predicted AAA+ superfamily ATPase
MQLLDNRSISVQAKSQELKSKMSSLTVAHPHVVYAEQKLAELLRKSYLDSAGLLITGPTGMGKTTFANAAVRCLSAGVLHTPTSDKRPVIFVNAPQLSSRGGLATELLIALGDKSPTKGKIGEKILRIANYCRRQEVKLIIIDEIHDYLPKNVDGSTPTVTFLKQLMNATKVPFLFMGTEKAKRLISNHPELAGRVEERVEFPTFKYGPTKFSKYTFAQIVNAYARI